MVESHYSIDIRELCILLCLWTAHWPGLPALFCSYVTSHCLAAAPQSGAKAKFYCTVYYTTLDSNCEAQRASKNLKKIVEDRVQSQNYVQKSINKIRPRSPN